MRICFLPPDIGWAIDIGYLEIWENFVQCLPHAGPGYEITTNPSVADFVINAYDDPIDYGDISSRFRPLSRRDVETYTWNFFDRPTGRYSGFYSSLSKDLFDPRRHTSMSFPGPFNEMIEEFPRLDAVFDFSFVGQRSAGVRTRIFEQFFDRQSSLNAIVRDSGTAVWVFTEEERAGAGVRKAKRDYADVLRQSKFILCPRGFGPGSFRMFEAMQAGRVPVIISDAYVKPAGIDWDSCSLTIPESRIAEIPETIRRRMDDWECMAETARKVWEFNFSPLHVMDYITTNLVRMSGAIERTRFSPLAHSLRVGTSLLQRRLRPLAGQVKRSLNTRAMADRAV